MGTQARYLMIWRTGFLDGTKGVAVMFKSECSRNTY